MKTSFLCAVVFLFTLTSKGQAITPEDFRLCLDNYGCSDSTIKLTKKQLLEAQTLSTNFSWFTITDLTFYFSPEFGSDVTISHCRGNSFCKELKQILNRCSPGSILVIVAQGKNKSGKTINWCELKIKVY